MPTFKITVRRRKVVEQDGCLEVEAPTLGDAYMAAAFDMPEADVVKGTNWHGPVMARSCELFVPGPDPELVDEGEDDAGSAG